MSGLVGSEGSVCATQLNGRGVMGVERNACMGLCVWAAAVYILTYPFLDVPRVKALNSILSFPVSACSVGHGILTQCCAH